MWCYAAVLLGIAAIAEIAGLGGVPGPSVGTENILFIVLLLAFIVTALRRFLQH
jgi:uncharacterized membrane protein YtjA (UPF0391 family)